MVDKGNKNSPLSPPGERGQGVRGRIRGTARVKRARAFRKDPSLVETILWRHLRNRRLGGWKFRRQQPIGRYVADFACLERKLIIEADGGQHRLREAADRDRDIWFGSEGYRVLRFPYSEVVSHIDRVLERIFAALEAGYPSPPAPSPPRGEGRSI
jgi:very-short-patch-repair endonuclease